MRCAEITRNTTETKIQLSLNIDGTGQKEIDTGCGFLNHMLELFASHGRFDLKLICNGDLDVDAHHTVEDVAIVLGQAFDKALGERRGICRYGNMILPMDEALILAAIDISGRSHLGWALDIPAQKVGDFDTELIKEFMLGLSRSMNASIHLKQLAGENSHHIIEASFKALGRALNQATKIDPRFEGEIPSTKGTII